MSCSRTRMLQKAQLHLDPNLVYIVILRDGLLSDPSDDVVDRERGTGKDLYDTDQRLGVHGSKQAVVKFPRNCCGAPVIDDGHLVDVNCPI